MAKKISINRTYSVGFSSVKLLSVGLISFKKDFQEGMTDFKCKCMLIVGGIKQHKNINFFLESTL